MNDLDTFMLIPIFFLGGTAAIFLIRYLLTKFRGLYDRFLPSGDTVIISVLVFITLAVFIWSIASIVYWALKLMPEWV